MRLATIAAETVEIINRGSYESAPGVTVDVSQSIKASVANTVLITPEGWPKIEADVQAARQLDSPPAALEVTGETTLRAAQRLSAEFPGKTVALNFASAKNPGGGFLGGARAQEESLARASALYASLCAAHGYYQANRTFGRPTYTDHAILSPNVAVFRDGGHLLLPEPYAVTFITMPAVNAGAIQVYDRNEEVIARIMQRRIGLVLALAASIKCEALILGAWGCGAFRNDPQMIAGLFARQLSLDSPWRSAFRKIVFPVFDPSPRKPNFLAFQNHLEGK